MLVAQCNSGDSAGDRSRVVGYASLAFHPALPTATTAGTPTISAKETAHVN